MNTFQHIRSATAKVTFAGLTFLVDPILAPKDAYPGFKEAKYDADIRNPMLDLPFPIEKVLEGIDAVIVTHTHLDHWDDIAVEKIPKEIPIFTQHAADAKLIRSKGFKDVRVTGTKTPFKNIFISKTAGEHGSEEILSNPFIAEIADESMGFVLRSNDSKSVIYFAGDTIWNGYVEVSIKKYNPDYIVLNTGYAELKGFEGSLIMGKDDVVTCCNFAPNSKIICVHMDAINHCSLKRKMLREFVKEKKLEEKVFIPDDGECIKF